jgi:hypothetical protein
MVVISVFPMMMMSALVPVLMAVIVVRTTASEAVVPMSKQRLAPSSPS